MVQAKLAIRWFFLSAIENHKQVEIEEIELAKEKQEKVFLDIFNQVAKEEMS
jgi:hypothetical protein